jgi:glycosyltransferase involved in cell wall biosynthesis
MLENLTCIILTFNEEKNISTVLNSIQGLTKNIFVVDSFSTDRTLQILEEMQITYTQHAFENYSKPRNGAQDNTPLRTDGVWHLEADEPVTPELRSWIKNDFEMESENSDGFMFSRKTIFMDRWIKHGGQYPNFHLRLFKVLCGSCERKAYDQHFLVEGRVKKISNADIINTVSSNLDDFIIAHNRWAAKEAFEIYDGANVDSLSPKLFGNPIERRRWLKQNIFEKSPLFIRSFLYFFYRYFIRLGFLDGKPGLIFFVLQTFWFRFLIDAKVYELLLNRSEK